MNVVIAAAALNATIRKWGIPEFLVTGEPCHGAAVDGTSLFDMTYTSALIKCNCCFNNGSICHVTQL